MWPTYKELIFLRKQINLKQLVYSRREYLTSNETNYISLAIEQLPAIFLADLIQI